MKLIATDLDGTLLNKKGEVSAENAKAIRMAMDRGIKFVVATGRSYDAASKPLQEVGLSCPIICLNGANTYSLNKELLRNAPMDLTVSRKIQAICRKEDVYFELFTNNGVYSTNREHFMEVMVDILTSTHPNSSEAEIRIAAEQRFQNERVQFVHNYDDLFSMDDIEIYKILAFSLEKGKLSNVRSQLDKETELAITSSGDINLEFNHPDAQKGIALANLADSMGVRMEDVMALGDNFNDASMLQMAGIGVAMGNAVDEIKELCSHTTKSNNDHGVAFAIEQMLKKVSL
ncbi:Cof-type HAD-IIB family hydrolase [Virgibacillus necropolis]|uniref:Hydrolase n=1 Tax=Virgibacillus necropolis TaxID=163877 RepID=A0A221MFI1_9BACI|nr:Cof-type HAD-IIB family hydrolase [Virgibacillus necropolis]ASN06372.1 hypothetical protein CFK40_15760 [Virgibacillus necropolis]